MDKIFLVVLEPRIPYLASFASNKKSLEFLQMRCSGAGGTTEVRWVACCHGANLKSLRVLSRSFLGGGDKGAACTPPSLRFFRRGSNLHPSAPEAGNTTFRPLRVGNVSCTCPLLFINCINTSTELTQENFLRPRQIAALMCSKNIFLN